jgi:hypothetical protein
MDKLTKQQIGKNQATQKQLTHLLRSLAADQDWQPDPGEWSIRFIAAHLATTEKECYQDRVVRIAAGENPCFESYFNTGRDFSKLELLDSLSEWTSTRREIIEFVSALPEEKLALTGTHAAFGVLTIQGVLKLMLDHDQEHIENLEKAISKHRLLPNGD